jgi:hypothetical protein
MNKRIGIVFALLAFLAGAVPAMANDIYIAQSAVGGANGADCADAFPVNFFNTAGNWGSAAGQIGPGTTVHLCGTITFPANSTGLTALGSGSSTSPITILFEKGAILQSPVFTGSFENPGGAILINGHNYITINGNNTGLVQNTSNGTGLAYSQSSYLIYIKAATGITVEQLTVANAYQNQGSSSGATDVNGWDTDGIFVDAINSADSNIIIDHNTVHSQHTNIAATCDGNGSMNGLQISNNTVYDQGWAILADADSGTYSNVNIYGNDVSNYTNWEYPTSQYHTDGVFIYTGQGTSPTIPVLSPNIYNNYFHGNLGNGNSTAYVFCTTAGGNNSGVGPVACNIFNNLFVLTAGGGTAAINLGEVAGPTAVYNNTFIGPSVPGSFANFAIVLEPPAHVTLKNNIFMNYDQAIIDFGPLQSDVTASDYNLYYGMLNPSSQIFQSNYNNPSAANYTLAQWQGAGFGYDAHAVTSNPQLDSSYRPQSATGLGVNLANLNMAAILNNPAINYDKSGVLRPAAWTMGAYVASGSAPAPPASLTATVQ